jgi:hypothetical protein
LIRFIEKKKQPDQQNTVETVQTQYNCYQTLMLCNSEIGNFVQLVVVVVDVKLFNFSSQFSIKKFCPVRNKQSLDGKIDGNQMDSWLEYFDPVFGVSDDSDTGLYCVRMNGQVLKICCKHLAAGSLVKFSKT